MEDIIFVRGNIIVESGKFKVKELIAYAPSEWEKIADVVKPDDFKISEKNIIMPYNILCASEDIIVYGEYLTGLQYPKEIERIFFEEMDKIQRLRTQKIEDNLTDVMNRLIYTGIVGVMELFLCDFLLSMVLGLKKYFNRYYWINSSSFKSEPGRIQDIIFERVTNFNYHRIKDVNEIYKQVLEIEFSSIDKLVKLIKTRHNLVHRIGYEKGSSEYIQVTTDMIDELLVEVKSLVQYIINSKKDEIENWIPILANSI